MSFSALVVQILISSPSDLPNDHRSVIARTIRRWNNQHSRFYNIHYSPTDSEEGGAPGFGEYAQAVLNEQIVNESDMVLAIFTDRLGTPTPDYESGTAEEIGRALSQNKEVAVLQNDCPRKPVRHGDADKQAAALTDFLKSIRPKAFIADYDSTSRLTEIVDQILSTFARKYRNESSIELHKLMREATVSNVEYELSRSGSDAGVQRGIWPRVEVGAPAKSWWLVLESNLPYAARNVRYSYIDRDGSPDYGFDFSGSSDDDPIEVLPPNGEVRFNIIQAMQSPSSAKCRVEWEDEDGETHSTEATVRTI